MDKPPVFISYSTKDKEWVTSYLLPNLEKNGIPCHIDFRDFELGTASLINMEQTVEKSSNLAVADMFRKALENIRRNSMSLEASLFDKKHGAVWNYPSKLVINTMRILFEATKKGVKNAALSAMAISRYVKQIHNIEESLRDMLSESTASMRLLSMFLAPLIAGVTVTMASRPPAIRMTS